MKIEANVAMESRDGSSKLVTLQPLEKLDPISGIVFVYEEDAEDVSPPQTMAEMFKWGGWFEAKNNRTVIRVSAESLEKMKQAAQGKQSN